MAVSWDLAGRARLTAEGIAEAQVAALRRSLAPFPADGGASRPADVVIAAAGGVALDELAGPANDGLLTARTSTGAHVLVSGGDVLTVPGVDDLLDGPARLQVTPGFPLQTAWASVLRPAVQLAMVRRGAAAVHAAAVEREGGAWLITGWSESGKTEVALALAEAGAAFLTDKWAVTGTDGAVTAFPVGVGVRGWVLDALPGLRRRLPARARAQLSAARLAGRTVRPFTDRPPRGRLPGTALAGVERAIALGERAGLRLDDLRMAYGLPPLPPAPVPLAVVVVLVTGATPEVVVDEAEPAWAARRLAQSAAYERRVLFDLQRRATYVEARAGASGLELAVAREVELLTEAFGSARRVLRVRCPFPGDPRRVVEALAAAGA
jgi:hypothetical protein